MTWMQPLQRYFEFSGRSSRAEYWPFIGVAIAAYFVAGLIDAGREGVQGTLSLALLLLLAVVTPAYAATFRRLHDRGVSGWVVGAQWILNGIYFVVDRLRLGTRGSLIDAPFKLIAGADVLLTIILGVFIVVQLCREGDAGSNAYGAPPAKLPSEWVTNSSRSSNDPVVELERAAALHRNGVLTDGEFAERKAAILQR